MKNLFRDEKFSSWMVIIIAFLVLVIIIQVLGWQYHKTEKEEVFSLKQTLEQTLARSIVKEFMNARLSKNESQSITYLTEKAMEQVQQGKIDLTEDFQSFKILESRLAGENKFEFLIEIQMLSNTNLIERIEVTKISDRYYVNSIEMPG